MSGLINPIHTGQPRIAVSGDETCLVPLQDVVGKLKSVPLNHPLIQSAREVGTCLGDGLD